MLGIKRQRTCPACGRPVGARRLLLQASITARWDCSGCGAALEFDPRRRLAVSALCALLGLGPMVFGGIVHVWWAVALGVGLWWFFWSFDGVRVRVPVRGRGDR